MNQKIHHYKTINATALTSSLIISLIPCFIVGGDFWAEAFAEYFDTIKNIESILNIGWGGYYSFFPQFVAAIYNEYLVGFTSPWFAARFFSSLVFFITAFLSLRILLLLAIPKNIKYTLFVLVFLGLSLQGVHPSTNSIISVGYFFYLPLLLSMMASYLTDTDSYRCQFTNKFLFVLGLFTKPSLLVVTVFFGVRRSYIFKLVALSVFLFQYYLTKTRPGALAINFEVTSEYFQYFIESTLTIIGLMASHLFLFDLLGNYALIVGVVFTSIFCIYLLKYVSNFRLVFLLLALALGTVFPFVFLALFLKDEGYELSLFVLSLAKSQYWILPSVVIPFVLIVPLYRNKHYAPLVALLFIVLVNMFKLNIQQLNLSASSNVDTKSMIASQIPKNKYWRCFPILPLPGFPLDELQGGFDSDLNHTLEIWKSGGCRTEVNFSSLDNNGFNNSGTVTPLTITNRGSYSYLIMLIDKSVSKVADTEQCNDIYGNSPIITKANDPGSISYITGWKESKDGTSDPNRLYDSLNRCFNINIDRSKINVIAFFPDKKQ